MASRSKTTTSASFRHSNPRSVSKPGSPGPAPTRYTTPPSAICSLIFRELAAGGGEGQGPCVSGDPVVSALVLPGTYLREQVEQIRIKEPCGGFTGELWISLPAQQRRSSAIKSTRPAYSRP